MGGAGWVQIANFVLTGSLFIACAVGMRRALGATTGGKWAPRLVTTFGLGLVIAGIFVTDAGAGFPAGAPAGRPDMTWHGAIHEFGHVLNVVSFVALCGVMIRRSTVRRNHAAAAATLATLLAALVVGAFPDPDTFSVRIVVATVIEFAFVAAGAVGLHRQR